MKALLIIAALALVAVAVLVFIVVKRAVAIGIRKWRVRHARWTILEESNGSSVRVLAVRPGDRELQVACVEFTDPDFDSLIYEARAEGRAKVYTLNEKDG